MSILADRMNSLPASPTVAMTSIIEKLRHEGKEVIALSMGEPDFDTPPHIQEAAHQAIRDGHTRYTPPDGTMALKQAISDKFKRENGLSYGLDQIVATPGGKQVIFAAFLATLNVGDEVIIPAPYWVSYPDITRFAGGTPIIIQAGIDQGFKITPEQLANAITPKTKWLIFNSPSNPTGAAYTREEIAALMEVIRQNPHVWVLSDDIYEHITYDGFEFSTPAQVAPDLMGRILTLNGVSKSYAMTGWRIGYGAGPRELISAMRKIQSQSTNCPTAIAQMAAIAALNGPQDFLAQSNAAFKERRDFVVSALNAIEGITCPTPQGAFYVYADISGLIGKTTIDGQAIEKDEDFSKYLLQNQQVALVFGAAFGASPAIRMSYATDLDTLKRACEKIAQAVKALS